MTRIGIITVLLLACSQPPPTQEWRSPSGKSFRVLATGPIQGQGWSGVLVKYDAPSEDPRVLRENADELVQAMFKTADEKHVDVIVVTADHAPGGRKGLVTTSRGYNDVYRRAANGAWEHIDR